MTHWRTINVAVAIVIVACLGYVMAQDYGFCGPNVLKDTPAGCAEFWFNRYQTLFSAIAVFAAALIAVRPVWKQLGHSAIQTTVALRDATSAQVNLIATRAEKSRSRLKKFWIEFANGYESRKDDLSVLSHWVWDQESIIDHQISFLENEQTDNIDGDEATIARQKLLTALRSLETCLYEMNATVHQDYNAENMPIDDAEKAAAKETETRATAKLPKIIMPVENAIISLGAAFDRDTDALRLKRQLLDQMLAASEVD
jgi:hypothetical protein